MTTCHGHSHVWHIIGDDHGPLRDEWPCECGLLTVSVERDERGTVLTGSVVVPASEMGDEQADATLAIT